VQQGVPKQVQHQGSPEDTHRREAIWL